MPGAGKITFAGDADRNAGVPPGLANPMTHRATASPTNTPARLTVHSLLWRLPRGTELAAKPVVLTSYAVVAGCVARPLVTLSAPARAVPKVTGTFVTSRRT